MERAGTGIVSPSTPHLSMALHLRGLVVHHEGAGTSAAALRAGFSSVVVPFFGDQPSWVWRPLPVGAAPPALRRKGLTAAASRFSGERALSARGISLSGRVLEKRRNSRVLAVPLRLFLAGFLCLLMILELVEVLLFFLFGPESRFTGFFSVSGQSFAAWFLTLHAGHFSEAAANETCVGSWTLPCCRASCL